MPKSRFNLRQKSSANVQKENDEEALLQAKTQRDRVTRTEYTPAMKYVYDNLIGSSVEVQSPFGDRRMTYADYTASGRSLYMIENYITKYVISYYGNTHTSTSYASMQTGKFRDDAKAIVRRCCNASMDDAVIFCGSGATAAINKLIHVLGLCDKAVARSTVIFLGPYEHHSNILPWKETGAKLVRIKEDRKGQFDCEDLERQLREHANGPWRNKVGTFSACSNVTGLVVDTIKVTTIMHANGGLAFWDYAAGAPYLKIDMNPRSDSSDDRACKDGIFCSPHKFVGGPGSPGLLIAKKKLFTNEVPHATGGGTVVYVTHNRHSYTRDIESREEGGTPAIIESIRAGLVFQLKAAIGIDHIHRREIYLARKGINALHGNPNIILLGSKISPRVPILSFAVRHPASAKLVHHNFIALLLSDLFGIQARGGCACAGPYAQDLLGIAEEVAEGIMAFIDVDVRRETVISLDQGNGKGMLMEDTIKVANSLGIMKPGFVRLNLPYFLPDTEIEFILAAVNIVANEGWKLLPQYAYDVVQGSWLHRKKTSPTYQLMSLNDVAYNGGNDFHMFVSGNVNPRSPPGERQSYSEIMKAAERVLESADAVGRELYPFDEVTMKDYLPDSLLSYVWWLEPQHAMLTINNQSTKSLMMMKVNSIPIKPRTNSGPTLDKLQLSARYPSIKIQEHVPHRCEDLPKANPLVSDRVKDWVRATSNENMEYPEAEVEFERKTSNELLPKSSKKGKTKDAPTEKKSGTRRATAPSILPKTDIKAGSRRNKSKSKVKTEVIRTKSKGRRGTYH